MPPFELDLTSRVIFGAGGLARLGELAAGLTREPALLVSDPGIVRAGHVDRARSALESAGFRVAVFDGVEENPTTEHVDRCVAVARELGAGLLVGLGGGSSMDTAKGANFLLSNGGRMADYWGIGKATRPMLPSVAVPTTAGTGSEAQSFALIADAVTHRKMACGDRKASFQIALLDPELTVSQPPRVTALCGIDAIAHTLETAVCTKRNPASILFSREAWARLSRGFSRVLRHPDDLEARGEMLLGANFAGTAIEHSMLGITHSLANPLTAVFGVTHGAAVGVMLPHVLRFNAERVDDQYREVTGQSGAELADRVSRWLVEVGLSPRLADHGVDPARLPDLAEMATREWTASFNPRSASAGDFLDLYRAAG
jgi:alcohol dehydrogenase